MTEKEMTEKEKKLHLAATELADEMINQPNFRITIAGQKYKVGRRIIARSNRDANKTIWRWSPYREEWLNSQVGFNEIYDALYIECKNELRWKTSVTEALSEIKRLEAGE